MIGRDPDGYFKPLIAGWTAAKDLSAFDPRALALYAQAWSVPERIHAMCEDYRAGAGADREADRADIAAGRTLAMPVLVLASRRYLDAGKPETALAAWRRTLAPGAVGVEIESGHFLVEENPAATLAALRPFLDR